MNNFRMRLMAMGAFLALTGILLAGESGNLHDRYDALLKKYVKGESFDYQGLFGNKADLEALHRYVDQLAGQQPSQMSREAALAFWINLYNAGTLRLVLDHYPVESIKDIGGLLSSPWNKKIVTVEGEELTLNQIENEVIRPQFGDARIHFALNCASIGCPPLAAEAFTAEKLDQQLTRVTRQALGKPRWVEISSGEIRLTKIFDWYKSDFEASAGSVRQFIAVYLPDQKEALLDESRKLTFGDYDWRLNKRSPYPPD
ncbi:MAG TPA: DUF547 domain-containing protein [Calditrichia bacterium]|nr:DUF547 domain-containing protein [Calditrichota bacterium]HQU74743.1 DUF547 domain-containing protein [Calditrichia bacterium]HQV33844.1 DUF547 domain-containing protein [Calditrichia bacterium]